MPKEVAITRSVIESLIANARIAALVPVIGLATKALERKPNCSKCKQKQNIQAQANLFNTIKSTLHLLPKTSLDAIKSELGADFLVIHKVDELGRAIKKLI